MPERARDKSTSKQGVSKEIVKVFKLPRFGLPTRANVSGKAQALEELLSSDIIPRQLLQRAEAMAGVMREPSEDDGSLSTSLNTGTKDVLNRSRNRSSRLQLLGNSFRFAKRKGSKSGLAQSHDETPNSPEAVDDSLVPWLHPQSQGHSKLPIRTRTFGFERGAYANVQADVDTNPNPNPNSNANVNGSADIEGKEKGSKSSEETLKKVRALRERSFESFYPDSVRRLKWLLILFTVVLLFGTVYRFCLALVLNQQFAIYGPLVITCAERMAALGRMGKSIWDLILTQPNSRGLSAINATLRDNQFNYNELLSEKGGEGVRSFRQYAIAMLYQDAAAIQAIQHNILSHITSWSPDSAVLVDPTTMTVRYKASNHTRASYTVSMATAILSVAANVHEIAGRASKSALLAETNFVENFVLTNGFDGIVGFGKNSRVGVLTECKRVGRLLENWSFNVLLLILAAFAAFLFVVIPFVVSINSSLSIMLKLFLEISPVQLKMQLGAALEFLSDIRRWAKHTTCDLDIMTQTRETDSGDRSPLLRPGKDEESPSPLNSRRKEIPKESTPQRKRRTYKPHQHDAWRVLGVVVIACGALVGVYVGYDQYAKNMANTIAFQTDELYRLSRSLSYNPFILGYLVHYIATNKTGRCSGKTCAAYIKSLVTLRLSELNDVIMYHKGNLSLMTTGFKQLFADMIQGNPCDRVPYFRTLLKCRSAFGGIFTKGVQHMILLASRSLSWADPYHQFKSNERDCNVERRGKDRGQVATVKLVDMVGSLQRDFEYSKGSSNDIAACLNDQRLLDIELIHKWLLHPAFNIMIEYAKADARSILQAGNTVALAFFAVLVSFILVATIVGSHILLHRMRRAVYGLDWGMLASVWQCWYLALK